jgi:prevent-host-death family protein
MCYMELTLYPDPPADYVGVRELRQNLSVYLERVVAGETLRVTDRGRPVALLVPLPGPTGVAERLVASGRARPASGDVLRLGRPAGRTRRPVSQALRDVRDDRL